eukprot:SM009622S24743  [mRNA]  locus=s9622:279:494:- [translate_table: standard]
MCPDPSMRGPQVPGAFTQGEGGCQNPWPGLGS